jgi:hypothetical protein
MASFSHFLRAALLLAILAVPLCVAQANDSAGGMPYANISLTAACPGNFITANLSSDGAPVAGAELRLVQYEPYQGIRATTHTVQNGLAAFQLMHPATYRVYISAEGYDYPKYVEFDYPELCPAPEPEYMDIGVEIDCENMRLLITSVSGGKPLEGVFIAAGNWSSLTGESGEAYLPFEEGEIPVLASRENYSSVGFYFNASCAPPPECVSGSDCEGFEFCSDAGDCENVTGDCGYAENHTWIAYECCADADCGNESLLCANNACIGKPPPPPPANLTNQTGNASGEAAPDSGAAEAGRQGYAGVLLAAFVALSIVAYYTVYRPRRKK